MTAARTTLRDEQRDLTRRRIADAARVLFYERGVADTPTEMIARAAGVGRATLYLHFANKDAILIDLLARNLKGVRGIFRSLADITAVDAAAMRAWLDRYVATMRAHRAAMRLFHLGLANDVLARRLVDDHRDRLLNLLATRFPGIATTARHRAQALLLLARIDHVASAAAEDEPRIAVGDALELVAAEMVATLAPQAA